MKILIASADTAILKIIEEQLHSENQEIITALDGVGASNALQDGHDLVILDADLPQISGYECCRIFKNHKNNYFRPSLLLMSSQDSAAWTRFDECGADDFIVLPLHPNALKAKLKHLLRMSELYRRMEASHHHAEQEIRLAKHMFDSITKRQPQEFDFVQFWGMSSGHFCGDLFIMERTPENHLHLFLCDFTGHGLAAAIGALPASAIFFAMTRKGYEISEIAKEMNQKLYEIMPTGKFCSAALLRLEADNSKLEIWNGGLPPIVLINKKCKVDSKCESFHLPLSVADGTEFNAQTKIFELSDIKSILLYSDGLIEASNSEGEYFGEKRLIKECTSKKGKLCGSFNHIKTSVLSFLEGLEPTDDISLAVIQLTGESP